MRCSPTRAPRLYDAGAPACAAAATQIELTGNLGDLYPRSSATTFRRGGRRGAARGADVPPRSRELVGLLRGSPGTSRFASPCRADLRRERRNQAGGDLPNCGAPAGVRSQHRLRPVHRAHPGRCGAGGSSRRHARRARAQAARSEKRSVDIRPDPTDSESLGGEGHARPGGRRRPMRARPCGRTSGSSARGDDLDRRPHDDAGALGPP